MKQRRKRFFCLCYCCSCRVRAKQVIVLLVLFLGLHFTSMWQKRLWVNSFFSCDALYFFLWLRLHHLSNSHRKILIKAVHVHNRSESSYLLFLHTELSYSLVLVHSKLLFCLAAEDKFYFVQNTVLRKLLGKAENDFTFLLSKIEMLLNLNVRLEFYVEIFVVRVVYRSTH